MADSALTVEIIKKEIIKPSSPTPDHLKHLEFSVLDQVAIDMYTPLLLYYPASSTATEETTEKLDRLKTSLSKTLTDFYPFAGKTKENSSIECNDDGVDFIEARANCNLSDLLTDPDITQLNKFLPIDIADEEVVNGRVLLIQVTFFKCGGLVIAVSTSHKIADASSMATFVKSWSSRCHSASDSHAPPQFIGVSLFPPPKDIVIRIPGLMPNDKCVTSRLVFDASKLLELKAKATSERVPSPTRVESVTAFLWKCAMNAAFSSNSDNNNGITRPVLSMMIQLVNLRKRIIPPLPETCIGNLLGSIEAGTSSKEVLCLQDLVGFLRDGIKEFNDSVVEFYNPKSDALITKLVRIMKESEKKIHVRDDVEFYMFSSWSKFDQYNTDFGWGKPTWMSIASIPFPNMILLVDTKDGNGIEAWVTLKNQEQMDSLRKNEELLQFASFNPSVSV